jgi:hypothetical protein
VIEGENKINQALEEKMNGMTKEIENSLTKAYGEKFKKIKAKVDKLKEEFNTVLEETNDLKETIQGTYNMFFPALSQLEGIDDGEQFKPKNWSELNDEPPTEDGWLVKDFNTVKTYLETKLGKVSDKQVYEEQFTTSARSANGQIQALTKEYLENLVKLNDLFGKIKDATKEVTVLE